MPNKKRISKRLTVKDENVPTRNSRGVSKKLTQAVSATKMRMASKKLSQVMSEISWGCVRLGIKGFEKTLSLKNCINAIIMPSLTPTQCLLATRNGRLVC